MNTDVQRCADQAKGKTESTKVIIIPSLYNILICLFSPQNGVPFHVRFDSTNPLCRINSKYLT